MKILVAHNFYRSNLVGGEDIIVRREVAALKQALGDTQVHTYFAYNDELKLPSLIKNIFYDKQHAQNIQQCIQQNKIDILHVHNFFPQLTPSIILAAKAMGMKVVQTLHNFRPWCLSGILFQNNQQCTKCVKKDFALPAIQHKCYRHSYLQSTLAAMAFKHYARLRYQDSIDAYFVLSKTQQNQLTMMGVPKNKLLYKPNFIEPFQNPLKTKDKQGYLFVGRLEEAKGIVPLIKAWQKLEPKPELTLIGDGPLKGWVAQQSQNLPIKIFSKLSHQEVMAHCQRAKFLIHPGLVLETFGLTILEAMSCGTPVIGFDIGTRSEFIQNGVNGYLGDLEKILVGIQNNTLAQDYDKLSQNAKIFADNFVQSKIIATQLSLYQQI